MNEIVYVLINPAMIGYVKIGRTNNLSQRLKVLDNTSMPLPFECFYAAIVHDSAFVERQLHQAFVDSRVRKNREFFEIAPERVVAALKLVEVKDVTPQDDVVENEEDQKALDEARSRRANFNFNLVKIPIGSELTFTRDSEIKCEVVDSRQVKYSDKVMSLSAAAKEALASIGVLWKAVQGPLYWEYGGKTLDDIRNDMDLM
jgi:hypothetical protein